MKTNKRFGFRKCTSADVPLVAQMIQEMSEFLSARDVVDAVGDEFEPKLKQHLFGKSPKAEVRIFEVDGYPAGYCAFYVTFSTFRAEPGFYLEDIYVRMPFRSTGVGRRMMQTICKIARKRGCTRVEWVAPERDEKVNQFYESLEVPVVAGWKLYRARNTIEEMANQAPFDDDELD